jgi:4-amino-4-deoxy-L-arabinose transferase-like glycosyltransferase
VYFVKLRGGKIAEYGYLAVILLGLCFYLYNLEGWRINDDEGSYLYQAWRISEGEVPYRDFLTPQLPLFLYSGGLIMRILGPSFIAARVWNACLMLFASVPLFLIGKTLFGSRVGLLSTLVFLLHPEIYQQGRFFRPEALMMSFSTWGLYLFVLGMEGKRRWLAASGASFALGTLAKLFGGLPLLGCILAILWEAKRRSPRRTLGDLAAILIPYFIIVGAVFGYFLLFVPNFYLAAFGHHLMQGRELSRIQILIKGLRFFWRYFQKYIPFLLFSSLALTERKRWPLAWQVPTASVFLFLSRELYPRHLMYLVPTLCLFFALSLERLWRRSFFAISIVAISLIPWGLMDITVARLSERGTERLVEYIRGATDDEDYILADYSGINFYSRRRTTYSGAALSHGAASSGQITGRKLIKEIEEKKVKMILIDNSFFSFHHLDKLRDYPLFRDYVQANFQFVGEVERATQKFEVYVARGE